MARSAMLMERTVVSTCALLILVLGVCFGSPSHRLVCWKAILMCHGEPECHYAFDQYLYACGPVLSGVHKKCPSHCISSLIQLNLTRGGPALENCDCALDPVCKSTKQAIEPCLPRTSTMGCTEARLQCEMDHPCRSAMRDYLYHCRKLFGGQRCSEGCRRVISDMRSIPKAQQLDTCVCDGTERNICEYIKVSMKTFCSDGTDRFAGSGFSDTEDDSEDDYMDQEDYQYVENSSNSLRCHTGVLYITTFIMVLIKFI